MKVRFLLDENLAPRLAAAVRRLNPEIDILRVGDDGAPPLAIPDPSILLYLADHQRLFVTDNRSTMPAHLTEHYVRGGQPHGGILWVRPHTTVGQLAAALHLIWVASEAEEWYDRTGWVPF